jgi:hypothetical protein
MVVGLTKRLFLQQTLRRAFVRSLEIIVPEAGLKAPHDPYSKIPSRVEVNAVRQSGR